MSLEGKVAYVTGAAQGIGFAIAEEFAKEGANVVLGGDHQENIDKATAELASKYPGEIIGLKADVTDSQNTYDTIDKIVDKFGRLDYAVNNAGGGVLKPFAELTDEDFDKTIDLDLRGTFLCMRAEIKYFLKQGYGSIVNAGALGSFYNPGGMGAYNAAKNGIMGMTQAAATDYADKNIRINAVAPGLVETPLNTGGFLDKILPTVPMKRAATPEEIAKLYVFVASQATFMTGQTVLSDGGASVGLKGE
jgi:3-oxoacyl-[acyl-carrier protein] reductase